ncbi:uncharacterized protein LOC142557801 isoform X2 [Dermacentor variabilis]|uniref:uncharacterized protein LOC142557801 isoform X2 n=1 Tax=Dermacentor variabilis TaxID=34621 RepID=UPI003F5C4701
MVFSGSSSDSVRPKSLAAYDSTGCSRGPAAMSGSLLLPLSRSHREAAAKPAGQPAPCPTAMAQQPREKRRSLLRWLVSRSRDRKTPSSGSLPLASLPKSHTYSGACCKEPQHRAQRSLSVYDVLGDPQQPAAPKGATDDASQRPLLALCRLCLTVVPSAALYRMTRCGCYFCLQCTRQYLTVSIRDGNAYIPCPDDKCPSGGVFESSEIEKLVERDVLELYLRCKLNRDVEMDPHQTWCPGPGCESICRVFPPLRDCEASPVHCSKCKLTFCSSCKERWHAYQSCDEFRRQFSEDELMISCCGTMTKGPARTSWATHGHLLSGTGLRLWASLPDSASSYYWPRPFSCWQPHVCCAAGAVAVIAASTLSQQPSELSGCVRLSQTEIKEETSTCMSSGQAHLRVQ